MWCALFSYAMVIAAAIESGGQRRGIASIRLSFGNFGILAVRLDGGFR